MDYAVGGIRGYPPREARARPVGDHRACPGAEPAPQGNTLRPHQRRGGGKAMPFHWPRARPSLPKETELGEGGVIRGRVGAKAGNHGLTPY